MLVIYICNAGSIGTAGNVGIAGSVSSLVMIMFQSGIKIIMYT